MQRIYDKTISITVHRAIDDRQKCQEFMESHRVALANSRVESAVNIASNNSEWCKNPGVYLILARSSSTKKLLSGARIHLANDIAPLPIQQAIGETDPLINSKVNEYAENEGVGELCAYWNTESKALISEKLILAAITFCQQLPIKRLLAFTGMHMTKILLKFGFELEKSIGNTGELFYPNERYRSHVISIDTKNLDLAPESFKREIRELSQSDTSKKHYLLKGTIVNYDYSFVL